MVRKQSASKSTEKHFGAESPLTIPFTINPKQPHFWNMKFLPERGYDMKKAHANFKATVEALHWEKFVEHRTHYMEQLVREFYAGLITKSGEILSEYSIVRGMKVKFDEEEINKHYHLSYTGDSFEEKLHNFGKKRMEQIKNRVAVPNAPWEKISHSEFKLKVRYIISELSNWHMFINCSIMPTSHNYTLPKDRLIVLDCIMTDEEINLGRIINKEIRDCAKKTEGFLYFPCLITELCEKQGVKISEAEKNQKKRPPSALSAEMKTRRVFKDPEELGKEKKKEVHKHQEYDQEKNRKDDAVRRFLLDQHEWIKKRLEEISDAPTNLEIPQFPLWIFEEAESEKESEKELSEEEEVVEKKKKILKRKRETKEKGKGKKKAREEEWNESEDTEEEEDEELKKMEKETDEEDPDTATEGSEEEKSDSELDLTMEEMLRKKKGKSHVLEQIDPSQQSPPKTPAPMITTPPSTPTSTGTTPPQTQKEADVTQEKEKQEELPKETSPTLDQTKEQTPPPHDKSTILLPFIVSETGEKQVTEDISISAEGATTAEKPVDAETGASAPGASAPEEGQAATATERGSNLEEILNIIAVELAAKKREELGNSQKFFKKSLGAEKMKKGIEGSTGAGALAKEAVKEVSESEKEKGAEEESIAEEESPLKDIAETLTDMPATTLEKPKEAEVQRGAQSPGEPAPELVTPPATRTAALKPGASGSKSTGKKEKKQKPKATPTRSSSRLRSGAKPQ